MLGLMPATGVRSMEYSADRNMYFALGNQLKAEGYSTYAYHNHTYTYYGRDKSHPNLGYSYKGIGNGLELDYSGYYPGKNTKTRWPNSDYLMAKATADEYMTADEPFHTYYLTVSGHMLYTFMGNSMSSYHKSKVADLPYSDEVKAYLACQIELDLMVEELIAKLEEKGIAEDTLIVLTADHYPYGLQQAGEADFYSELAGKDTTSTFEKYRNTLIMWHKGMESMVIDEPVYSIDLLPTLSNLFGLEYDSRLMMGRDFLSDAPALVCFADRSWVTEYGQYDSKAKTFTLFPGQSWTEENKAEYVKAINTVVRRKFDFSNLILKQDYYDILFGK
ncbi:MAG: sulfatase-like hydrolase/transferase [Clostridia bacterium]|nr:sulfatase-like hydrolase/transferase [Clostridia bacterium]